MARNLICFDFIEKKSKGLGGKKIFICGPVKMIRSFKQGFMDKGVNKNDILSEEFNF